MEIDTNKLTDEQISKLNEFIHTMEEENTKATKWWIMPRYPIFGSEVQQFGQSYYVAPQEDSYVRNRPPLKSDFNTAEEANAWLNNYLLEEDMFKKAIDEINTLKNNLGSLIQKLRNHQYITNTDIHNCFELFNESWDKGSISKVIKRESAE